MLLKRIGHYISSHWRGQQGLLWSFAVNLVLLRALIYGIQMLAQPGEYEDYHDFALAVLALAVFFHGIVFIWQAVGIFRAGEAYIRERGAIASHWGAQLGVIIAFWITTSQAINAWQMTIDVPEYVDYAAKWQSEREARYDLLQEGDDTIRIRGTLELGVTKRLAAILADSQKIRRVVLTSEGGNIYEARGLAKLFNQRAIETVVEGDCSSACTTAFIGGSMRVLRPGARLGFHQYRVEANYVVLGSDPRGEEERDKALYRAAGVKAEFVDRMHKASPDTMWYPGMPELLDAGVLTAPTD